MKKYKKFFAVLLAISMVLPGLGQVVVAAEKLDDQIGVIRLGGIDREGTAVLASQEAYRDGAKTVVLTGFSGEVDALTGTLLAGAKKGPLLITRKDKLSQITKTELKRLKAKTVYIIGGTSVVSESVETELEKAGYAVRRIQGSNRNATAVAVAKEVKRSVAKHVFLALGKMPNPKDALADALAIGPVSIMKNSPVLLTETNKLPAETIAAMKDLGVERVTIVGGTSAISNDVEVELRRNYTVNRVAGNSREKTALAIAEKYFEEPSNLIVVYGRKSADALVGGYLGALKNAPILLTNNAGLTAETRTYIEENPRNTYVLGGTSVVTETAFNQIIAALKQEVDLTAYQAALAAVVEADYTAESWKSYKAVVRANLVTKENTQEEVDAATAAIISAQADLMTEAEAAAVVVEMIKALPLADKVTLQDKAAIEAAREAYRALSKEAKVLVTNLAGLKNREDVIEKIEADIEAAQEVIDMIKGLPVADKITLIRDKADIQAARVAYEALTEEQKALVTNLAGLKNREARIKELESDLTAYKKALGAVEEKDYTKTSWAAYQKIVANNIVTVDDPQSLVDEATAAIIVAQKDLVAKDKATAEAVETMIGKLPLAADLVIEDKADVEAARTAYNGLTKEAKKLVKNLQGLENREERIQKLEARLTIEEVKYIADIEVEFGGEYTLPGEVGAILSDDTLIWVPVKWNQVEVDVNKAGSYQVEGTLYPSDLEVVAETDKKATVNVVVKAADLTGYNEALALEKDGYTEKSWAVYQKIVVENSVTAENTQKEIDAASGAILAAQKNLVTEAEEVAAVDKMIKDLPWAGKVTLEDKADIEEAKAAYDALSDIAKALIDQPNKLLDGVVKINKLVKDKADAAIVSEDIKNLPWLGQITLADREDVEGVRAAYDALSPEAKELVKNLDGLEKREAKIEELIIATFTPEELINMSEGVYDGDLELNPTGTRDIKYGPETGMRTIDGDVTIVGNLTGTIDLRNLTITGDLTVDTPNATVNNSAIVEGTIFVINVSDSTWNEKVDGNEVVVNGMTIYIAPGTVVESLVLKEGTTLILGAGATFTNPVVVNGNATIISPDTFLVVIEDGVKVVFKDNQEDEGREIVGNESEEVDIKVQVAAEKAVASAEGNKTNASRDLAQELVANLQTGKYKENLQARLDEIVTVEDEAAAKEETAGNVIKMIGQLPWAKDLVLEDKTLVEAARTAYNELSEEEKTLVTNLRGLENREARILLLEAEVVVSAAEEAVAEAEEIKTDASRDLAQVLVTALPDGSDKENLQERLEKIVTAEDVVKMIKKLPWALNLNLLDQAEVSAVREAYEALPDQAKALVNNLDKLEKREAKIEKLEAKLSVDSLDAVNGKVTVNFDKEVSRVPETLTITADGQAVALDAKVVDGKVEITLEKVEASTEGVKEVEYAVTLNGVTTEVKIVVPAIISPIVKRTVETIETFEDIEVEFGGEYQLPTQAKVTLSDDEEVLVPIVWEDVVDVNIADTYALEGTLDFTGVMNLEETDKVAKVNVRVAEEKNAKVTFDVKGAKAKDGVETELTVKKGTQVELLTYFDIEKEGYTLKGWLNTTTNEEITGFKPSVEVNEDVMYEAIWEETIGKLQMYVYSDKPGEKVPSKINLIDKDGSKTPMSSNEYGPSYRTWNTDRSLKNGEYTFEFIGLKENLKITMEGSNISESSSILTPEEGSEKTSYKVNLKFKDNKSTAFTRVKINFELDQEILAAAVNAVNTADGELALWDALNSSVFEGAAVKANIKGYKPEFGKGNTQFATAKEIQDKIEEINQKISDDAKFDVLKEDLEVAYPNQVKVNTILTKEFVDADIDNISLYMDSIFTKKGKVKNKIASLEDLERTIKLANAIRIAEDGIENLPKIKDITNSAEDKTAIADVKALIEVVKGLDKDAKVKGEEKIADLEARIAELVAFEKAEEAVEKAESTNTREDYQSAFDLVNPLKTSIEKDGLKNRLKVVLEAIESAEANQALEEYEAKMETKDQVLELVNDDDLRNQVSATKTPVFNKIQLVKEGKEDLLDRLDIAHNKLIAATAVKALQNASKDLTVVNLDNAKIKLSNAKTNVKNLADGEIKTALNELIGIEEDKIVALQEDIEAAGNVDKLIAKFSATEINISEDYIAKVEAARAAYDDLSAEAKALVKESNLKKLEAAEVKIPKAAAVKAINEAPTQIKLWQALRNEFFKELAIEENILEYEKVFGKDKTEFNSVEEIREKLEEINKAIADQSKFEKIKADLEKEHPNQIKVFNILNENFEEVNSDYMEDYMEKIFNNKDKVRPKLKSLEAIQEAISSVNRDKEVDAVNELIKNMPFTSKLVLTDKEQVVEARAAYDRLTDTQKESVEAENYQKLINNENKIIFLERELALIPAVNSASSTEDMEAALQAIVDAKLFTLTNLSDPVAIDEANEVLYKKQESGFEGFKTIEEIDEAATL